MVVGAFPVIKLASLAIRQISKPIARRIEQAARNSPFVRQYICIPPAQLHHWLDVNLRMKILGLGRAEKVEPLSAEAAVELGANMLSETFLFTVAVGTLTFEYFRQARKETRREESQIADIDELQNKVEELGLLVEQQDAKLREIHRLVVAEPWRVQQNVNSDKRQNLNSDKKQNANSNKK